MNLGCASYDEQSMSWHPMIGLRLPVIVGFLALVTRGIVLLTFGSDSCIRLCFVLNYRDNRIRSIYRAINSRKHTDEASKYIN